MEFDTSDVELSVRRRATTIIPIEDDDILEAACVWPRVATGTTPPPLERRDAIPTEILED